MLTSEIAISKVIEAAGSRPSLVSRRGSPTSTWTAIMSMLDANYKK